MATFLELSELVARDTGIIPNRDQIATTQSQTGRIRDVIQWVQDAWRAIQLDQQVSWRWMHQTFDETLLAGQTYFTPTHLNLERVRAWDQAVEFGTYDPALGKADWQRLQWQKWAYLYPDVETRIVTQSRPSEIAVTPDNRLAIDPQAAADMRLTGAFWRSAQVLSADGDVPELPEEHHDVIRWQACVYAAEDGEATTSIATWNARLGRAMQRLSRDQRPRVTVGGIREGGFP